MVHIVIFILLCRSLIFIGYGVEGKGRINVLTDFAFWKSLFIYQAPCSLKTLSFPFSLFFLCLLIDAEVGLVAGWALSPVAACGHLVAVAFLVAEHRIWGARASAVAAPGI